MLNLKNISSSFCKMATITTLIIIISVLYYWCKCVYEAVFQICSLRTRFETPNTINNLFSLKTKNCAPNEVGSCVVDPKLSSRVKKSAFHWPCLYFHQRKKNLPKTKKKEQLQFIVDCTHPVEDSIMDVANFVSSNRRVVSFHRVILQLKGPFSNRSVQRDSPWTHP